MCKADVWFDRWSLTKLFKSSTSRPHPGGNFRLGEGWKARAISPLAVMSGLPTKSKTGWRTAPNKMSLMRSIIALEDWYLKAKVPIQAMKLIVGSLCTWQEVSMAPAMTQYPARSHALWLWTWPLGGPVGPKNPSKPLASPCWFGACFWTIWQRCRLEALRPNGRVRLESLFARSNLSGRLCIIGDPKWPWRALKPCEVLGQSLRRRIFRDTRSRHNVPRLFPKSSATLHPLRLECWVGNRVHAPDVINNFVCHIGCIWNPDAMETSSNGVVSWEIGGHDWNCSLGY